MQAFHQNMDSTNQIAHHLRNQIIAICGLPAMQRLHLACNDTFIVQKCGDSPFIREDERWTTAITHIKRLDIRVTYFSDQNPDELAKAIALFISSANELEALHLEWSQGLGNRGSHDLLQNLKRRTFPRLQEVSFAKSFTTHWSLCGFFIRNTSIRSISLCDMEMRPSEECENWHWTVRSIPHILNLLEKVSLRNLWELRIENREGVNCWIWVRSEMEVDEAWILASCRNLRQKLQTPDYSEWLQSHRDATHAASNLTTPTTHPADSWVLVSLFLS
ncbi:uncharacterized protein BDZ99DRAFT_21163 [Mytilinidion resinicola]|uniref:F-box domain-containing protein n=1 Tax=Mytilinidion resinicola TaxID=574789 RepID=A0A6A6ZAC7_9PEZI|nr:uncharacterized protein BDZ99DRAFT_21163 [Mytilinidion resinicola]KAF2817649.1 hypothetical protein BDZ99DRAFT_21163 [Mytilinidion resinicola]